MRKKSINNVIELKKESKETIGVILSSLDYWIHHYEEYLKYYRVDSQFFQVIKIVEKHLKEMKEQRSIINRMYAQDLEVQLYIGDVEYNQALHKIKKVEQYMVLRAVGDYRYHENITMEEANTDYPYDDFKYVYNMHDGEKRPHKLLSEEELLKYLDPEEFRKYKEELNKCEKYRTEDKWCDCSLSYFCPNSSDNPENYIQIES